MRRLDTPDRQSHGANARRVPDACRSRARGGAAVWLAAWFVIGGIGCSSLPPGPEPDPVAAKGSSATEPTESADGISEELLYQLLTAEFAAQRGQLELAVANYLEAARLSRDPRVAGRATRMAVYARDEQRALQAAKLWSELDPDDVEAKKMHAALLLRSGRLEDAVGALQELTVSLDEGGGEGFHLVSEMLSRERDKKAAVRVMEQLVAGNDDNPQALLAYARLLARVGEEEQASEVMGRVLDLEPTNMAAVALAAHLLQRQGKTAQALELLAEQVERNPRSQSLRTTYARMLVDAKRYEEAREQFERLSRDAPDNDDVRYALGLLHMQTNRPAEARAQFEHLLKLGKRRQAAHFYLGQIAETENDTAAATAAYRQVDRGEHYLGAQIRIAVILAENDELEEAREHLHGLPRGGRSEAIRLYRAEAEILADAEQYPEAMAVYKAALAEFPGDPDLLYARAMLAAKIDDVELLERDLRAILERDPNNGDALNALGYTLADQTDR